MKELKDICIDLKYAKKLKELGVKQDSIFYWTGTDMEGIVPSIVTGYVETLECFSAFTATELLEIMKGNGVSISDYANHYTAVHSPNDTAQIRMGKKPANALAKMLIYLIENKLMEVK